MQVEEKLVEIVFDMHLKIQRGKSERVEIEII